MARFRDVSDPTHLWSGGEALQATSSVVDMILRAATTLSIPTSWAARTAVFDESETLPPILDSPDYVLLNFE